MPFFKRVFRSKDSSSKKQADTPPVQEDGVSRSKWTDAWLRSQVAPAEVQELVRACTKELKARGLSGPISLISLSCLSLFFFFFFFFCSLLLIRSEFFFFSFLARFRSGGSLAFAPLPSFVRSKRCSFFHSEILQECFRKPFISPRR